MRRLIILAFMGAMLVGTGACSSVKPLKLAYYRKNIIVKADETVWANDVRISMDNFRGDLVAQMIFEDSPIMVHFHEKLTRDSFDKVLGRLKEDGFKNYRCVIYSE